MIVYDFDKKTVIADGATHNLLAILADEMFYSDFEIEEMGVFSHKRLSQWTKRPLIDAAAIVVSGVPTTVWVGSIGGMSTL